MDTLPDNAVALSPLEQRRAQWRDFSDRVADSIQKIPMPTTWLEGERAMRCIGTADRVVTQIFNKAKAPSQKPVPSQVAAPARVPELPYAPQPEAPFVPVFDVPVLDVPVFDDGVDDAPLTDDDDDGDTDTGKAVDTLLDAMEAMLDDLDAGKKPAPAPLHILKAPASSDRFARHYNTTRFLFEKFTDRSYHPGASP